LILACQNNLSLSKLLPLSQKTSIAANDISDNEKKNSSFHKIMKRTR